MKTVLTITKREFLAFLNSPTAYVVAIAYLLPSYFMFWQTTLFNGEATMRDFFSLWPWFLMLLAPALTMRSLSEEKRKQTLDLLLVHPIKEWQIVAGKFLGAWGFLTALLLITTSLPFTVGNFSTFDWGQAWAGYLGAWLSGGVAIAIGMFVSSWTNNVISSFLVSAAIIFGWILIGLDFVLIAVPGVTGNILSQLSILTHVAQLNKGLVVIRDIVFFIISGGLMLGLTSIKLMEAKTVENKGKRRSLYLAAGILALIGVFANQILDVWSWRMDWSRGQLYSLSSGTKSTLSNLDDILKINFYTSKQLPAGQTQLTERYAKDLLDDYVRYGNGKVKLSVLYPDADPEVAQKAAEDGIRQVNFNSVSTGKLQVQAGYLGVAVSYGDKQESVEFISDAGNLEYELTRRIRKITNDQPKTIGVITNIGEKNESSDYNVWASMLRTEYTLSDVDFSTAVTPDKYVALLAVGPTEAANATVSAGLNEYLAAGGDVMLLLDKVAPDYQLGVGKVVNNGFDQFLSSYGISVNNNLVYDVENNEPVPLDNGPIRYLIPYSFWINSMTNKSFSPIGGIGSVTLGWASSLELKPMEGVNSTVLLTTGKNAGALTETFSIQPDLAPKIGKNEQFTLAAVAEKSGSKVVVVGDSDLAMDMFAQYKPANVAFLSNLMDWLTLGEGEKVVTRKDFAPAILQLQSKDQLVISQYGNIIGIPVLVGLFGVFWLRRRKRLSQRKLS